MMEEYVVIKKGSSIRHCISIPEDFMDKDLEIKIRPMVKCGGMTQRIELLYKKYPGVMPFKKIKDPKQWQRSTRNEWT